MISREVKQEGRAIVTPMRSWAIALYCCMVLLGLAANAFAVPPTVTGFSPAGGPVGTQVTINGMAFVNVSAVEFNGVAATFTRISTVQIVAIVPEDAITGKIRVVNRDGSAESADNFFLTAGITGFAPKTGPVGTSVVITGSNLGGTTEVTFNGTGTTAFTIDSNSQITATVPPGATTGPIGVVSPAGTVASSTSFRVLPGITGFTPISGPAGTSVVISGHNFTNALIVRFNFVSTTFVVNSDNQITAPVPANATAGPVMITNRDGTGASTFSFYPTSDTNDGLPVITNVTAAKVGQQTVITGRNLGGTYLNVRPTDLSVTFPKFGGGTLTTTPDSSSTHSANGTSTVKVTVPHGATHGPVTVTTPLGTASSEGIKDFILTPNVISYTPASGAEGDTIVIEGTGLASDSTASGTLLAPVVQFYNGRIVPQEDVTPDPETPYSRLTAKVPTLAQTGVVVVKTSTQAGGLNTTTGTPIFYVAPTITSISPETGPAGTVVVVNGRNFVQNATAIKFYPNIGVSPYSIKWVNTSRVDVTLPNHSLLANGPVTATTAYGTAESPQWFVANGHVPTITGFSPTFGGTGTTVTITGTNFTPPASSAAAVYFHSSKKATNYRFISSTEIQVDVPTGILAGPIKVLNAAGYSAWSSADFTPAAPTVTAVTSYAGTYTGPIGTRLSIGGTNFTRNSVVNFSAAGGGTIAGENLTYSAYNSIFIDVPAGAIPGPITVTNDAGTSPAFGINATYPQGVWFVPEGMQPVVTDFNPKTGAAGTAVTIEGQNFTQQAVAANQVYIGTKAATGVQFISPTQLIATVGIGALTGPVKVLNYAGWSAPSSQNFVTSVPTRPTFSPTSGPAGTRVRITSSTHLTPASKVLFTSASGTTQGNDFTWITGSYADVTVPADAITGTVSVENEAGVSVASSANFTVVSAAAPTITGASTQSGDTGDTVVLTGTNFTGATLVRFYSAKTATFTVDSDTQITATVPAGIALTGPLTVTNPAGTATSQFHFVKTGALPTILASTSGVAPLFGAPGTRVTVRGTNYTPDSQVHFTGTSGAVLAANIAYYTSGYLYVDVPAGAAAGPLTVTNAAGTSAPSLYWFVPEGAVPTISSFSPINAAVGEEITILGSNFEPNVKTTVYFFNGKYSRPTAAQFVSANEIRVTVPAGSLAGPLRVLNSAGYSVWSSQDYVAGAPAITSWASNSGTNSGPAGTTLTISGANLTRNAVINFTGASGSVPGINPVWISYSSMRVDVPAVARIGPISVTTSAGTSAPAAVWFVPTGVLPTVTSFTPASGPTGTVVTMTGTNFTPQSRVYFATRVDAGIEFVSPTEVRAVVPSNAPTTPAGVRAYNYAGYSLYASGTFTRTP